MTEQKKTPSSTPSIEHSTGPHAFAFRRIRHGRPTIVNGTRVRHSYGSDGTSYRAYVSGDKRQPAGRNLLHVKSLNGVNDLAIPSQVVTLLLKYALSGKRRRTIFVREHAPGRFHVQVKFRCDDNTTLCVGHDPHDTETPPIPLADVRVVQALLHRYKQREQALAGAKLTPSMIASISTASFR